jgi:hypothetical protein
MLDELFLTLKFGDEKNIILRVISLKFQRDRIEFGLERFQVDGCTIIGFVLQRSPDNTYIPDLKYINHEQRVCYGRFKEFTHEFS